jgi:hypothetical protein
VDVPLPDAVPLEETSLKFDTYRTTAGAWGLAMNERWEDAGVFRRRVRAAVGPAWELDRALALGEAIGAPMTTFAVGFDGPSVRMKLYFQEARWGDGVCDGAALRELGWPVDDGPVGVVAPEVYQGGGMGLKVYTGGADPRALSVGLADRLLPACPDEGGWYYLTTRLRPGQPVKYALNRIFDHVALAGEPEALARAWEAVGRLGLARPRAPGVLVVPTAIAVEDDGSADLYVGAWRAAPYSS